MADLVITTFAFIMYLGFCSLGVATIIASVVTYADDKRIDAALAESSIPSSPRRASALFSVLPPAYEPNSAACVVRVLAHIRVV